MNTAAPLQTLAARPQAPSRSTHAGLLLPRKFAFGPPIASLTDESSDSQGQQSLTVLRQEMAQRFDHDFSRVRVHSGVVAEQSARRVNADDFSRLPAPTVTTQLLADPVVSPLRQPDAGPVIDGGDAAIGADAGPVAAPTFPTYAQITTDATVSAAMDAAWTATKAATTATSRREQGFWIKQDTSGPSYSCTPAFTGAAVGALQTGAADPGTKPADAGTVHTVGLFHTHTPMTHRTGGTRNVGPSSADNTFHTAKNVAGVVYDYAESPAASGSIPAGHPLDSPAQLYSSGPNQRT